MFENSRLVPRLLGGEELGSQALLAQPSATPFAGQGGALRALDWSELSAKLEAARDLRGVLRRDARCNIDGAAASFGDAAASYFRAIEQCEPNVNPEDLEASKASGAMLAEGGSEADRSEARDDR